jgi:hypothetical protein
MAITVSNSFGILGITGAKRPGRATFSLGLTRLGAILYGCAVIIRTVRLSRGELEFLLVRLFGEVAALKQLPGWRA